MALRWQNLCGRYAADEGGPLGHTGLVSKSGALSTRLAYIWLPLHIFGYLFISTM